MNKKKDHVGQAIKKVMNVEPKNLQKIKNEKRKKLLV